LKWKRKPVLSPLDELLQLHNVLHESGKKSPEHTHTHTTFTFGLNALSNGLTVPAPNDLIMKHLLK